jgi:hypothetical protein
MQNPLERPSALRSSEIFFAKIQDGRFYSKEISKIRRTNASRTSDPRLYRQVSSPLYLLHDENDETLQDPATLYYHSVSIFNRNSGVQGEGEKELVTKDDLIVLSLDLLQRIGKESAYGEVIESDLHGDYNRITIKDKFVVKIATKREEFFEISMHNEYVIGYYGVNKVRRLIPNFIFTYGYFKCGAPEVNDGRYESLCSTETKAGGYVVIEKVQNSKSVDAFMKTCTVEDIRTLLLQIALSLAMAEEMIGFTHGDLHLANVMIKMLKRPMNIAYTVSGKKYNIVSNFVAVIIDYGLSRFESSVGRISGESVNNSEVYYPRPSAINDFLRFFVFSSFEASSIVNEDSLRDIYEILTGTRTLIEDRQRWATIYGTVYPSLTASFTSVIDYLYVAPISALRESPVFQSERALSRLRRKIKEGVRIRNVLQYYEYASEYSHKRTVLPVMSLDNVVEVCTRTRAMLELLRREREEAKTPARKKHLLRVIRSYCRLYDYFFQNVSYRNELEREKLFLEQYKRTL